MTLKFQGVDMKIHLYMPLALALLLPACNSGEPGSQDASQDESKPAMFQTQLDALDKAKGVEGMVLDAAEERKKSYDP